MPSSKNANRIGKCAQLDVDLLMSMHCDFEHDYNWRDIVAMRWIRIGLNRIGLNLTW